MDVVTELRLQRKECTLMFERTSWFFPLRLETASYDLIDMMYAQCVPDYIDGHLLTLDPRAPIPAKQLVSIKILQVYAVYFLTWHKLIILAML